MKKKKRLGVFVFFNKKGVVEDYVDYFLKDINNSIDNLYIMVIGDLQTDGKKVFTKYTNNIFYKENKGFTGAAWKKLIIGHITFDELAKYDEVIFFNDIFYGPVYPFKTILEKMDKREDLDFWGITRHYNVKDFTGCYESGIIPEHIQTYLYVVRNKMILSSDFREFWENLGEIKTAQDDVGKQETAFTYFFESRGYKWDTYVQMDNLKGKGLDNYCMNYEIPYTLLSNYDMPFIRRKSLIQTVENSVSGPETEARRTIDYVNRNTNYDINLIWDDLLRNNNIYDLYTKLHLNYVVSTKQKNKINKHKVGIFINIVNVSNYNYVFNIVKPLVKEYDIYFLITKNNEINNYNKSVKNVVVKNNGLLSLFNECKKYINKYEYISYISDEVNKDNGLLFNKSLKELLFDNTIGNTNVVNNIISSFENEPRLGYLGNINMIGMIYWNELKSRWPNNSYEKTKKVLDKFKIETNITEDKGPISLGNSFWIRTDAIKSIIDNKFDDISNDGFAISLQYICQENGYYSGTVVTDEYASIYIPALIEEYRRYSHSHPYTSNDTSKELTKYPISVLIKSILKKIYYKIKK